MHGLALRAVQLFVSDCYGDKTWGAVTKEAELGFDAFESMLSYDTEQGAATLEAIATVLDRPLSDILEDLGTYLVSHPNVEALRRLLRFGGVNFEDFLHSLDDLPDRARLAVADLELPAIQLRQHSSNHYSLTCRGGMYGWGHVLVGVMRTMADDYGALATVEHRGGNDGFETLAITLLETGFHAGREFDLGARSA